MICDVNIPDTPIGSFRSAFSCHWVKGKTLSAAAGAAIGNLVSGGAHDSLQKMDEKNARPRKWQGMRGVTGVCYKALLIPSQLNLIDLRYGTTATQSDRPKMNANQNESTLFIESLKRAGILIGNEREVVERLSEAREWHYAFSTLFRHGRTLGIRFSATAKTRSIQLRRIFDRFNFPSNSELAFEASLQG